MFNKYIYIYILDIHAYGLRLPIRNCCICPFFQTYTSKRTDNSVSTFIEQGRKVAIEYHDHHTLI